MMENVWVNKIGLFSLLYMTIEDKQYIIRFSMYVNVIYTATITQAGNKWTHMVVRL